jgi:hypothetical protein
MLDWTLLISDDSEFVIGDQALTMFDPRPQHPWTGNAWWSSNYAQAAVPVAPNACLLMTPGSERYAVRKTTADEVRTINLRSYGWADQSVFGTTTDVMESVREAAAATPDQVCRPRLPSTVTVEQVDEADEDVGSEHAARGWPRRISVTGANGKTRFYTYTFVDLDPDDQSVTFVSPEIAQALRDAFADQP